MACHKFQHQTAYDGGTKNLVNPLQASMMIITYTCHLAHILLNSQFTVREDSKVANIVRWRDRGSTDMQTEVCAVYVFQAGMGSEPYIFRFGWI